VSVMYLSYLVISILPDTHSIWYTYGISAL